MNIIAIKVLALTGAIVASPVLISCGNSAKPVETVAAAADSTSTISAPMYARGFSVGEIEPGVRLLDISDPEGRQKERFRFALVSKGSSANVPEGYERIEVPVDEAVCMTSLQLSNFIALGITDKVVGITSTRHLQNKDMLRQLKDGATAKIGIEGNFDTETLLALDPDVILISPFKRGGFDALRGIGIPLIPHLGYKELDPLGQAEWIKVVGMLTGCEAEADSIFRGIETRYNGLKSMVDSVSERPMVMTGEMRGGNWYAQGGQSFLACIFTDAGAEYFIADNDESGGVTLDYETVFSKASDAPYWRIVNSYDGPGEFGYDVLRDNDERYTDFAAWRDKGVIYCNMRDVPFYESMPVEPDKVLADFIYVFHPELMPRDFSPTYYRLLK